MDSFIPQNVLDSCLHVLSAVLDPGSRWWIHKTKIPVCEAYIQGRGGSGNKYTSYVNKYISDFVIYQICRKIKQIKKIWNAEIEVYF